MQLKHNIKLLTGKNKLQKALDSKILRFAALGLAEEVYTTFQNQ